MIRFSKIIFMNPAHIWISNIDCNYENLIRIVNIFECKWITLTIDSVTEGSPFLTFIVNQGLKHFIKQQSTDDLKISVMVPCNLFNLVLEKAIDEYPENIFIFNLLDAENWNEQLQYHPEELVVTGVTNMYISIALDENALLISVNRHMLSPKEIYKRVRAAGLK